MRRLLAIGADDPVYHMHNILLKLTMYQLTYVCVYTCCFPRGGVVGGVLRCMCTMHQSVVECRASIIVGLQTYPHPVQTHVYMWIARAQYW